ncbi:hypothetical protein XM38_030330 [Halomicronema hongdechloris C2206]|uniref:Uncharacterized protein n=1 Tax=Halomicronema hongdechloris C2206 TaxID=1641165 RepID=A0A1Z3HP58_9CYAN|nr:hypothetical protein [Halomicronema hongdechloris]ASC72079.1 hypothetical protein XM38_030330 [Halomicronema hongdechloris C2206]
MVSSGNHKPNQPAKRSSRRQRHLAKAYKPTNRGKPKRLQPGGSR